MFKGDFHLTREIADFGLVLVRFTGRGFSRSCLFQMLTHRKRLAGADALPPSGVKLFWLHKLGTFAQKIASERVGDEFAGFGDPVQCPERPKSRAPAFAKRQPLKNMARNLIRKAPEKVPSQPHRALSVSPDPWKWRGERFAGR